MELLVRQVHASLPYLPLCFRWASGTDSNG